MPVLGNIGTILLAFLGSGAVAALITCYLNAGKEELSFKRKKLEELYLAFKRFDLSVAGFFLGAYPAMKGQIIWAEFHARAVKNFDKDDSEAFRQVTMLIDLYFPDVKRKFEEYYAQRGVIVRIMHDHENASTVGKRSDLFEQFHKAAGDFGELSNNLKDAIVSEARKITSRHYLRPWRGT